MEQPGVVAGNFALSFQSTFWAFLWLSKAPFGRSLWSGHHWKDLFLLQKLSVEDANFVQKWWRQKRKKGQGSSRAVTGGTGVNGLRFRCTATGCSASTCLYKNGYVRLYSTFIWQKLHQWQWFPSLVSIFHLPELRFASQLLLEPPVIPTTKQNNTDKKLDFSTGRVFRTMW